MANSDYETDVLLEQYIVGDPYQTMESLVIWMSRWLTEQKLKNRIYNDR